MTGLFGSKEEKEQRKELEKNVKNLLKKFEISDLQKICQSIIGKEPEWWHKREFEKDGKTYEETLPPERWEFEDFIWKYVKKNEMTYEQIQDYAIRHSLVSRYYFEDNSQTRPSTQTRRDFPDEVKREILRRQDNNCNDCGALMTSPDFDHIDGDNSNNSIGNCSGPMSCLS